MEHEDLVEALERRLGSRKRARDAVDASECHPGGGRVPAWPGLGCSIRSAPAQADQVLGPGLGRPFARSWRPALTPFRLTRRVNQRDASPSPYVTQQRNRAPGGIAREPFTVEVLRFARYELPTGVSPSAVLPALTDRGGVYVLHFDDGHRYVGQARDVLVRLSDHRAPVR